MKGITLMKKFTAFLLIVIGATTLLASCASPTSGTSSSQSSVSTSSQLQQFTLSELAQYNGDEGGLAYVAVNGIVYDVTDADGWENGWHQGLHLAGTDATAVFATSPHSQSLLDELPIVGTLVD
jgi:predicted heme/steroid binding protein